MKQSLFLMVLVGHFCLFMCQLHEYHFVRENKTWTEAQHYCRTEYTDLATVSSMADMKRLRNINSDKIEIWIGFFSKPGTNATSHWSLPALQFNESQAKWKQGEPDNVTAETCGAIVDMTENQLVDKAHFLCYDEIESSPYKYYLGDQMTWFDALRYCRENHTDLISGPQLVELQKHLDASHKKIQLYNGTAVGNLNSLTTFKYMFIGLFSDIWTWSDGSSFSFRHWNLWYNTTRQKNPCTIQNEKGVWETKKCCESKPFFCYTDHVILINENRTWEEALHYCRHIDRI